MPEQNKKVIVDIGCFNARTQSLAHKLLHRKKEQWFGLMVEPNMHMQDEIHKSLQGTDYKYVRCAIGTEDKTGRLYMGKYGFFDRRSPAQKEKCMRSSLVAEEYYIAQHLTDEYQTVDIKTLNTLFAENEVTRIDILKIDTEGNDANILCGYDFAVRPVEIITEDFVAPRGKGTKAFEERQNEVRLQKYAALEQAGYTFVKAEDCNSYWVDANEKSA